MKPLWIACAALLMAAPATAQNVENQNNYAYLSRQPVPVIAGDVLDRPYRVIGHVSAGVRKATAFSKSASQEKVYRELWERGQKLGADAIIHAQYGDPHITYFSWGTREARGDAIKFLTPEEMAQQAGS